MPDGKDRYRTIVHEIGHTVLSEIELPGQATWVVGREARINGMPTKGVVLFRHDFQLHDIPRDRLPNAIAVWFGGIAAERVVQGDYDSGGAQSDFRYAADLCARYLDSFNVAVRPNMHVVFHDAMTHAMNIIRQQRSLHAALASVLTTQPIMGRAEIEWIFQRYRS